MTERFASTIPPVSQAQPSGVVPSWSAWLLRGLMLVTAILVFLQPVWAGLFVTGNVGMLSLHSAGHIAISVSLMLQIVTAILVWRPGRGPAWPIWATLGMFVLLEVQAGFGFARMLALHIPLGVLMFGLAVAMLIAAWSPRIRVRRSEPRRQEAAS